MHKLGYNASLYLLLLAGFISFSGCDGFQGRKATKTAETQRAATDSNPGTNLAASNKDAKTVHDTDIVVHSDKFDLTLKDYRRCVATHALEGRYFSKRALANPHFQRDESMRCSQVRFMRDFAEKNNIHATDEDIAKALQEYIAKANVTTKDELAEKIGYPVNDLTHLIEDALLRHTLQRYFVRRLSPDAQRNLFKIDYRRFSVDWLTFNNEISEEVTHKFMEEHSEELATAYSANRKLFMIPPKAEFLRFSFKLNGEDLNDGLAFQDANRLKVEAIRNGEKAAMDMCTKLEGCEVVNGPDSLYTLERSDKIKWAFRSPLGTVSDVYKEDDSCDILIVKNIIPPQDPDMKNEKTRFEIARKILSNKVPDERILTQLKEKLSLPDVDVRRATKDLGGLYRYVENVRFMDLVNDDKIPSKIVRDTLKTLTENEIMLFSNPLVENYKIQIFRARAAVTPTDADFDAQKAVWIEEKSNDPSYELVQNWLDSNMPRMTSLNLHPLEDAYGVLQLDGSIL